MSSPDTWREPEWLTYPWFGACACGRLRRTHVVRDASGTVDVIGRCDAGHETDLSEFVPARATEARPRRHVVIAPPAKSHSFDSAVLVAAIRAHLDAIAGFVDSYAELDPDATSPEDRLRLIEVECLVNQALDRCS